MSLAGNDKPTGQGIPLVGYAFELTGLTAGQKNTVVLSDFPVGFVVNGAIVQPVGTSTSAASCVYDNSTTTFKVLTDPTTVTIDLYPVNCTEIRLFVF